MIVVLETPGDSRRYKGIEVPLFVAIRLRRRGTAILLGTRPWAGANRPPCQQRAAQYLNANTFTFLRLAERLVPEPRGFVTRLSTLCEKR